MVSQRAELWGWIALAAIVIAFIGIVVMAPLEKTLGDTIRLIYVHAAFTRAGILGFYIAGILGLMVAITNNSGWQSLAHTIGWVSLGLFLVGGLFSVFAQRATWGGVATAEPRHRTTMVIVASAVIVQIVDSWLPWIRVRGLLYAGLAGFIAWAIPATPLVLHPANASGSSPSQVIRITFPTLTLLALLLGAWIVWYFQKIREL
jgi:hypothetical protein